MKAINPDDIPRVASIVMAIINRQGSRELNSGDLIDRIHDSLSEAFPGESVGDFQGLDFLLNRVKNERHNLFHLLFVPNHPAPSMPCQALLFAATGITISSTVNEYFIGGIPTQNIRVLIKPAIVMIDHEKPPSPLLKGIID